MRGQAELILYQVCCCTVRVPVRIDLTAESYHGLIHTFMTRNALSHTHNHDTQYSQNYDSQYLIAGVCGTCEYATEGGKKYVRLCTRPLTENLSEDNNSPPVLFLKKSARPCNPTGPVKYL